MLKILLHECLQATIGGAYLFCQGTHASHVTFAQQQRHGHYEKEQQRQTDVQNEQEARRGKQSEGCYHYRGNNATQQVRDRRSVLFQAREHVSRVQSLAPHVTAVHYVAE